MDTTNSSTPITSSDWDEVKFGIDESTLNSNLDFFSNLDTNGDVTHSITTSNNCLESSSLSGLSLLLDGENAHDFIGKFGTGISEDLIDDWSFLDWHRVSINLFKRSDV